MNGTMYDKIYDKIVDNLYIGSASALEYENQFEMIVNCTQEIRFPKNSVKCYRIPILDDPYECVNFVELVEKTNILETMHETIIHKNPVLVHCFAGIQRSPALVALYLIRYHKYTPETAIQYIRSKRPIAFFGAVNFMDAIDLFYRKINAKKND